MSKLIQARVLTAFNHGELKLSVGEIFEADQASVELHELRGDVDSHKSAVAYAKEQGCKIISVGEPKKRDKKTAEVIVSDESSVGNENGELLNEESASA